MDFSSVPRALESLQRRQPPLDPETLQIVTHLQTHRRDWNVLVDQIPALCRTTNHPVRWEPLAVAIFMATQVLQNVVPPGDNLYYAEGPRVPVTADESALYRNIMADTNNNHNTLDDIQTRIEPLCEWVLSTAAQHLEHSEPRVRTLIANAAAAAVHVAQEYRFLREQRNAWQQQIVTSIQVHLQQGRDGDTAPNNNNEYSRDSNGALDDTTGWRALETNWHCLAALIAACRSYWDEFTPTSTLWEALEHSSIQHVNRHVRAAAMAVLEQLVRTADPAFVTDAESPLRQTVTRVLQGGLADNWSQVRMAASVLARTFLTKHVVELQAPVDDLYPILLPRMCLNRFYLAQGVKLYSHETWKLLFPESALTTVRMYLPAMVRYYVQMCDADNHVVREGACQAIAELATKFPRELEPQIPVLLQALLVCFHDESWPVRDEACLACGLLCKAYPEECREELPTLWNRWTEQLTDPIWSVRQDAAVALGDALESYGEELLPRILELVSELLPSAKSQPAMSMEDYKAHQNDMQAHSGGQMYSCGSLAPKLGKKAGAGRIGGCSSCSIDRPKAPWEETDGCIYLIRELIVRCSNDEESGVGLSDEQIVGMLKELLDVCRVQHFPQWNDLRTTLWRQLPVMAHALGKERFKRRYLDLVLDLLFATLDSRSATPLCSFAAAQCAEELSELVGVGIFRGRLDEYQRETFDRVKLERSNRVAPMEGPVSPFGPPGLLDTVYQSPSSAPAVK